MGQIFTTEEKLDEYLNLDELNKSVKLDDDTLVSYAEIGYNDAEFTLFMIPGISGNRLCIEACYSFLKEKPIRVILLDYPGYGKSSLVKNRSLAEYVSYFENILRILVPDENHKIGFYGVSAGCVHISQLLVDERFRNRIKCAVFAGPWAAPTAKGSSMSSILVSKLPVCLAKKVGQALYKMNKKRLTSNDFRKGMKPELTPEETTYLKELWNLNELAWSTFMKNFFELSKIEGFVETFLLCCESKYKIKFDLNKIGADTKVKVFYGTKDKTVPPAAVENYYLKRLSPQVLENNFNFVKIENGTHDGVPFTTMENAMEFIVKNSGIES